MPRPCCPRRVGVRPNATFFKPAGVPMARLAICTLAPDEVEALRLADLEGLYHDAAADKMGVSRATFGRILERARRKVAGALVRGEALRLENGAANTTHPDAAPPPADELKSRPDARGHGRHACHQRRGRRNRAEACGNAELKETGQ